MGINLDLDWDRAMSGDEFEILRSKCDYCADLITRLMREKNIVDRSYKNDDLNNFWDLTDKIWQEYSKEKTYDECKKILADERDRIIKKYKLR
ncbi:hypothetical protein HMPREF9309_01595 [Campylobacter ureolyticus ACS-301-V-Sch3b]|uniref:Uncharacterized protein n=1 Tax=Campylobacter ureolyticus ACS-301-V-Sch3b TaxID=883165 RepID=S3X952_9BACT|nr:hypothetical protein [Campylobacter ureolyticus]EPH07374.1 hypothetical protein HMPREF9309_01595 [Campylobacter ureolyticus ACS-301-V-Sch3b]MCZ6156835.1 hypothetical protein [Campylobacter ureolyticus]